MDQLNLFSAARSEPSLSTDIFDYEPGLFSHSECTHYLQTFLNNTEWTQRSQLLYGKEVITPRLTAWFGDRPAVSSGGKDETAFIPLTADLQKIREKVLARSGLHFDSVLLNYYRNGNDSVSWHSDNDSVPGKNKYVASVSFGQAREFEIRNKTDHTKTFKILLENGSYLLMKGLMQEDWQHRIAKSKQPMGARINLTFRILQG